MAKRIVAKTGEYTNAQNEQKSEWTKIGIIGSSANGEYILLDPTVNLAGVLTKQNMLAAEKKRAGDTKAKIGTSVMCSIFDDANQNNGGGTNAPRGDQFDDDYGY